MKSKSQEVFPVMEDLRKKIKESLDSKEYKSQKEIAEDTKLTAQTICRFLKGDNISCENFSRLLDHYGFIETSPDSKTKKDLIDLNMLKKHRFIERCLDEINRPESKELSTISLIKILINLLNSELIREENNLTKKNIANQSASISLAKSIPVVIFKKHSISEK